jgi:hypothetical protein
VQLTLHPSAGAGTFSATLICAQPEIVTLSYTLRGARVLTGVIARDARVPNRIDVTRTVALPSGRYRWTWTVDAGGVSRTSPEQTVDIP